MKIRFLPAAEIELSNAAEFYEEARPGLGADFMREMNKAIELVLGNTKIGQPVIASARTVFREFVVARFPYRLVYSVEESDILIIAVAHQHRRPMYWQYRVQEPRQRYTALPEAA